MLSASFCLLFSAIYHIFGCLSEDYHDCLLKVDLCGIAFLLGGSYFPMIYYGFICYPDIQRTYMIINAIVFTFGIIVAWVGGGNSTLAYNTRCIGFPLLAVFGVVPMIRNCYILSQIIL